MSQVSEAVGTMVDTATAAVATTAGVVVGAVESVMPSSSEQGNDGNSSAM
jgi:hypothetical protein